jgi:hypothetical protein
VQFDLYAIRKVGAWLVHQDVTARDQKQSSVTLEEEAARIG